ncbi:MAG: T9SS type A sorting domain-containing protein, partial [Saprospiraceae bacterium]|nr:T9SS type A sorting domain-containing protein [Saprospiraceae bacterium]
MHSFLSSDALSIKDVPFYAVPREKSGIAGDLILIDLFVGTESNPLLESNGLAFNFSIPQAYVEDNSLSFSFSPAEWYGYNNPTINTVQYPTVGRVEAALSRTAEQANDGFGVIGTFQIVLQEDLDGFKPEDDELPIEIEINGGQYITGSGQKFGLESSKTTIYLDLIEDKLEKEIEIISFPNPADQKITIHANNQDEIQNVFIYNTVGQSVSGHVNVGSNHFELMTSQYPEGMYMARVETLFGVSVEKIQVIRD